MGVRTRGAAPIFFGPTMPNITQENKLAIQEMLDANAAAITDDDQSELMEQALLNAALQPASIRSASGEEIRNRPLDEIMAAQRYLSRQQSTLRTVQMVPGGTG